MMSALHLLGGKDLSFRSVLVFKTTTSKGQELAFGVSKLLPAWYNWQAGFFCFFCFNLMPKMLSLVTYCFGWQSHNGIFLKFSCHTEWNLTLNHTYHSRENESFSQHFLTKAQMLQAGKGHRHLGKGSKQWRKEEGHLSVTVVLHRRPGQEAKDTKTFWVNHSKWILVSLCLLICTYIGESEELGILNPPEFDDL